MQKEPYIELKITEGSKVIPEKQDDEEPETQICESVPVPDIITPSYFDKIILNGVYNLDFNYLKKEIDIIPGENFDINKLNQISNNLKKLNVFKQVYITSCESLLGQEYKNILLRLIEDDPYEVRVRVGFQQVSTSFTNLSASTYRFGGSFIAKNISNKADSIRLDLDITRYKSKATLAYQVPWTFGLRARSIYQLYAHEDQQFIITGTQRDLYRQQHIGFLYNINTQIQKTELNIDSGVESMRIFDISPELSETILYDPNLLYKRHLYFYLEPALIYNRLDDNKPLMQCNPTRGSYTLLTTRIMVPTTITNGYFIKFLLEHSKFFPLIYNSVFAIRGRLGYIVSNRFNTIIPTERFYLGGSNSIRSYETNQAPPLNVAVVDGTTVWIPTGGKTMFDLNAEIRALIYKQLSGVIFNDLGILTVNEPTTVTGNDVIGATGFGLRYQTPVGPIRFDIGWKWRKRDPQDKSYAWYITFGQAF